jgi:hypothetical protein
MLNDLSQTPQSDVFLGRVNAPDEQTAISTAIVKPLVTNRYHQRTLIARKAVGSGLDNHPKYSE